MYQLSDLALKAILEEWYPQEYDPPYTDVLGWARSIESLCDTYGIPDVQRAQCAAGFIKGELRTELLKALADSRAKFGPVHWNQLKSFIVAFDRDFREQWEKLRFYEKYPGHVRTALVFISGVLFVPAVAIYTLYRVGFTSAGIAAGSPTSTIRSIIYGGDTGGLFPLLRSVGATATSTGAAATGIGVATNDQRDTSTSEPLHQAADSTTRGDDNDGNPYLEEYILTHQAILAIVESWDVRAYDPPGTDCTSWLREIRKICDQYEIPTSQRALCAMLRMSAECNEAARAAGCCDMTWDEFTLWLRQYDREGRKRANRRIAEL